MSSDNHKTTHQDNIQIFWTPSTLIQTYTRGSGIQHQHPGHLQQKPGQVLRTPSGDPLGLCLIFQVPHRDN